MTQTRHTVDTITSDALDALYDQLARLGALADRAETELRRVRDTNQQLVTEHLDAEEGITAAIRQRKEQEDRARRAEAERDEAVRQRAESDADAMRAEAAIARVRALVDECDHRGITSGHPLTVTRIRAALAEPTPATEATDTVDPKEPQ